MNKKVLFVVCALCFLIVATWAYLQREKTFVKQNNTNYNTYCDANYTERVNNTTGVVSSELAMQCQCNAEHDGRSYEHVFYVSHNFDYSLSDDERLCETWCDTLCKAEANRYFKI